MKKSFLSIPAPCNADWDAMAPVSGVRHCSICSQTVVDFTNWSDAAILTFFSRTENRHTCGQLRADQLNRALATPATPPRTVRHWLAAAGVVSLTLAAPDAIAQIPRAPLQTEQTARRTNDSSRSPDRLVFAGLVTDLRSDPLPDAVVSLSQEGRVVGQTTTDVDGRFSISPTVPLDPAVPVQAEVRRIGFLDRTFPLQADGDHRNLVFPVTAQDNSRNSNRGRVYMGKPLIHPTKRGR